MHSTYPLRPGPSSCDPNLLTSRYSHSLHGFFICKLRPLSSNLRPKLLGQITWMKSLVPIPDRPRVATMATNDKKVYNLEVQENDMCLELADPNMSKTERMMKLPQHPWDPRNSSSTHKTRIAQLDLHHACWSTSTHQIRSRSKWGRVRLLQISLSNRPLQRSRQSLGHDEPNAVHSGRSWVHRLH